MAWPDDAEPEILKIEEEKRLTQKLVELGMVSSFAEARRLVHSGKAALMIQRFTSVPDETN